MAEYDVAIVGGNLAGLCLAKNLLESGLKIAIFERNETVTDTFLGACLSLEDAKEFGLAKPEYILNKVSKSRAVLVDANYDLMYTKPFRKDLILIDENKFRIDLKKRLIASGVDIYYNSLVSDFTPNSEGVDVHVGDDTYRAKLVIGADGVTSKVANYIEIKTGHKSPFEYLSSFRGKLKGCKKQDRDTNLFFIGPHIGIGYAWAYPCGEEECNFGIGSIDKVGSMNAVLEKLRPKFSDAELVKKKAGMLPYTGLRMPLAWGRFMLAGHAGGIVNSLMGGGLSPILKCSKYAAKIIRDAYDGKNFDLTKITQYNDLKNTEQGIRIQNTAKFVMGVKNFCRYDPDYGELFNRILKAVDEKSLREVCEGQRFAIQKAAMRFFVRNPNLTLEVINRVRRARSKQRQHRQSANAD